MFNRYSSLLIGGGCRYSSFYSDIDSVMIGMIGRHIKTTIFYILWQHSTFLSSL